MGGVKQDAHSSQGNVKTDMKKEQLIYAIAFLMDGSSALVGLYVPLLAMEIGGTYDDLGGIRATGAVVYSLSCFIVGRFSDRVGYRRFMTLSGLTVSLLILGYLLVDRVWQLFLLGALTGVMLSGFWPCMQAWLGQGKDRGQLLGAVGRFNVSWSLGILVGPVLGGVLYAIDPAKGFALGAGLVGCVFFALLLVRVREETAAGGERAEITTFAAARRFLPVAWTANFATFFSVGVVRSLFPKLATDLGIGPELLGWLLAMIGLGQVIGFLLVSRTDRWQFRLGPLVAFQALAMVGLGAFAFGSHSGLFAAGMLTHGLLIGMTFTSSIFYSLHALGAGGKRTGIHEGIIGSGVFVGPLVGGLVAEYVGARAPYLVAIGVQCCALALEVYLVKRNGQC